MQAKAREEAIRVLGDAPVDVIPTAEQWSQMPYIHQAIKEVSMQTMMHWNVANTYHYLTL